jgi:hypothetical protein
MSYTQQDRMYTTLGLCFLIYFLSFFSCLLMDMYGPDGPRHFFWLFAISYLMHSGEHTVNVYYRYDTTLFFSPAQPKADGWRPTTTTLAREKYKIKKRKLGCWTRCNVQRLDDLFLVAIRYPSIRIHGPDRIGKISGKWKTGLGPLISFLGWEVQTPVVFLVTSFPFFTAAGLLIASNINDMLFDRITIDCSYIV